MRYEQGFIFSALISILFNNKKRVEKNTDAGTH